MDGGSTFEDIGSANHSLETAIHKEIPAQRKGHKLQKADVDFLHRYFSMAS